MFLPAKSLADLEAFVSEQMQSLPPLPASELPSFAQATFPSNSAILEEEDDDDDDDDDDDVVHRLVSMLSLCLPVLFTTHLHPNLTSSHQGDV